MVRCGNAENFSETAKERKRYAPKSLPPRRPRALTLPLNDNDDKRPKIWNLFKKTLLQRTFDQQQSPLFARLPAEIRLMIWKEFLGGHWLHVLRAYGRLIAIKCEEDEKLDLHHRWDQCWGDIAQRINHHGLGYWLDLDEGCKSTVANLVPLLKTCRLIYSEAVHLLYRANTFDLNHIDTIINLSQTVLQPRLNLIRILYLRYTFPYDMQYFSDRLRPPYYSATWEEACRVLASLKGLEELYMDLDEHPTWRFFRKRELLKLEPVFRPMLQITRPGIFDVNVPWNEQDPVNTWYEEGTPFRLICRGERPSD